MLSTKFKNIVVVEKKRPLESSKWLRVLVIIVVISAVSGVGYYSKNKKSLESGEKLIEEEILLVKVKSLSELVKGVTVKKISTIEPAIGAPLMARMGGRVTGVNFNLGETVSAGQIIVSVDGGVEANPARAQLAGLRSSLILLDDIEREALRTASNAVKTAQLSVGTAQAGRSLSVDQVRKGEEQASLLVRQAELAFEDAVESESRIDQVVRAADIGLQAARIAQEQAEIAGALVSQQTGDGLKQATQGLFSAEQVRDRVSVEIQSQRVSLQGQVSAAAEQVRLAQIISPVSGQVTRLTIKKGDFIRPGQEVGEIIAFEGAQIKIDVTTGVRGKLSMGQEVRITARGQEFMGEIVRLADGPRSDIALWQVDIFIDETPEIIHPGDLVIVELPVGVVKEGGLFIPLDVVAVRQDGIMLMTVDEGGIVSEHLVEPMAYSGDYIEALVDLPDNTMVVVNGSRTLRTGDMVQIES